MNRLLGTALATKQTMHTTHLDAQSPPHDRCRVAFSRGWLPTATRSAARCRCALRNQCHSLCWSRAKSHCFFSGQNVISTATLTIVWQLSSRVTVVDTSTFLAASPSLHPSLHLPREPRARIKRRARIKTSMTVTFDPTSPAITTESSYDSGAKSNPIGG